MVVNEQLVSYINSLNKEQNPFIQRLEQEAHEFHVPIVREETRELLKVLVRMNDPLNILEIGTAIGYSSIIMHSCQRDGGKITTIERNEGRYEKAIKNIKEAGYEKEIQVLKGDALDVLENLTQEYDFIFMDAAKGQYSAFFNMAVQHLSKKGVVVCDNVLQDGEVSLSRFGIERRNRTIHKRMREFLYELKHMEEFETTVLPVGDGVTVSKRIG